MKSKQKKKIKKTKFNPFILIRNIIILVVIILSIIIFFNLLSANKKNTSPVVTPPAPVATNNTTSATPNVNDQTTPGSILDYKQKQYQILTNLFRYNQNLYLSMDSNNIVNIAPDSENAITALNNNLTAMASKLNSSDVRNESLFLTDLKTKNTTFVNDITAYNTAVTAKNPNKSQVAKLLQTVQASYKAVNDCMNQNMNLFK
ncbi:MAG: hypothetical protein ACRC41_15365 [Sarcina sp.]